IRVGLIAVGYVLVGSLVTLGGWIFDVPRLTDWLDDGISMFVNTAICTALCAVGLVPLLLPGSPRRLHVTRFCGGAATLIALLTAVQHVTGWDLGIDTLLLAREWGQNKAMSPMRMGPPASFSIVVLGTTLLLA